MYYVRNVKHQLLQIQIRELAHVVEAGVIHVPQAHHLIRFNANSTIE